MALSAEDQPPLDHVQPLPPPAAVRRDIPPPRRPAPGRPPPPRGVVRLVEVRTDQIPAVPPEPERPPLLVRSSGRWRFTATTITLSAAVVAGAEILRHGVGISLYPSSLLAEIILIVVAAALTSVAMTARVAVAERRRRAKLAERERHAKLNRLSGQLDQVHAEIGQTRAIMTVAAAEVAAIRRGLGRDVVERREVQDRLKSVERALTGLPVEVRHEMQQMGNNVDHRLRVVADRDAEVVDALNKVAAHLTEPRSSAGLDAEVIDLGRRINDWINN